MRLLKTAVYLLAAAAQLSQYPADSRVDLQIYRGRRGRGVLGRRCPKTRASRGSILEPGETMGEYWAIEGARPFH